MYLIQCVAWPSQNLGARATAAPHGGKSRALHKIWPCDWTATGIAAYDMSVASQDSAAFLWSDSTPEREHASTVTAMAEDIGGC